MTSLVHGCHMSVTCVSPDLCVTNVCVEMTKNTWKPCNLLVGNCYPEPVEQWPRLCRGVTWGSHVYHTCVTWRVWQMWNDKEYIKTVQPRNSHPEPVEQHLTSHVQFVHGCHMSVTCVSPDLCVTRGRVEMIKNAWKPCNLLVRNSNPEPVDQCPPLCMGITWVSHLCHVFLWQMCK